MPQDSDVAVLWIAEYFTGTLAKVDTRLRRIVARYKITGDNFCETGEALWALMADSNGDIYATTLRTGGGGRVVAIRNTGCEDQDGDGAVVTSSHPNEVLPFGEDECLKWTFEVPNVTSVAFQREAWGGIGLDRVWLSDGTTHRVWAVDPETGEETGAEVVLEEPDPLPGHPDDTEAPHNIDIDIFGRLYAAMNKPCWGSCHAWIAVVDTATLTVNAFLEVPYSGTYDQMIQDHRGRLWARQPLASYDSFLDTWTVPEPLQPVGSFVGIPLGDIWASIRLPSETVALLTYAIEDDRAELHEDLRLDGTALALDRDGQVWEWDQPGVLFACGSEVTTSVWVWDPWTMERELVIDHEIRGGLAVADNPTGVTPLDVRTDPRSTVVTFAGCEPDGETVWRSLSWSATTVGGTSVQFVVQANNAADPDDDAEWLPAGVDPPSEPPVRLNLPTPAQYLHLRATLTTNDAVAPPSDRLSPELLRIEASYECVENPK